MNEKINKFLLGTLWLIASTLGLCFWMNINFGFNLLSGAHWRHLAYMQATQQPIKTTFYISLFIGFSCIIFGMYVLIRPRLRRIKFIKKDKKPDLSTPTEQPTVSIPEPDTSHTKETVVEKPVPESTNTLQEPFVIDYSSDIPPAPVANGTQAPNPLSPNDIKIQDATITQNYPEIVEIFESVGYTIKTPPCVGVFCPALTAIGHEITLWIGAVDVGTNAVQGVIDAFKSIFEKTLDGEIDITTKGFVVNATDASDPEAPDILLFDSIDKLREYMQQNPDIADEDSSEEFEAFSQYISTVIKHIEII